MRVGTVKQKTVTRLFDNLINLKLNGCFLDENINSLYLEQAERQNIVTYEDGKYKFSPLAEVTTDLCYRLIARANEEKRKAETAKKATAVTLPKANMNLIAFDTAVQFSTDLMVLANNYSIPADKLPSFIREATDLFKVYNQHITL